MQNDKVKKTMAENRVSQSIDPSTLFRVVEVDDTECWEQFILGQMVESENKLVVGDCEFGGSKWIYRGQSNAKWPIDSSFQLNVSPSFRRVWSVERALRGRERESIREFKKLAWRYVQNPEMDDLEWLTLMRHHGVPTRLVDFSESALIALYFALEEKLKETEEKSKPDFAVWAINRDAMTNCYVQSMIGKQFLCMKNLIDKYGKRYGNNLATVINNPKFLCDQDVRAAKELCTTIQPSAMSSLIVSEANRAAALKILTSPLETSIDDHAMSPVIYLYPEMPSPRMLAQKGLFLMAARISEPFMDSLFKGLEIEREAWKEEKIKVSEIREERYKIYNAKIIKFVFHRDRENELRNRLRFSNCVKGTMYPDIEGAAEMVKENVIASLANHRTVDSELSPEQQQHILMCGKPE